MPRDGDAFFATRSLGGFSIVRPTAARFIGCRVPREAVAALLGRLDDTPMSFVRYDTEALGYSSLRQRLADTLPLTTPELQRLTVGHMQIFSSRRPSRPRAVAGQLQRDGG